MASPSSGNVTSANDVVDIVLPADAAYLALLRTATAGLAARLDFTLDEIEDLRIAVDEACALLLVDSLADRPLLCTFTLEGDALTIDVAITSRSGAVPDDTTFAWTVLAALTGSVSARIEGDVVTISLRKQRGVRE